MLKSFNEYQELAAVTRKPDEQPLELAHYALGLAGEAGEISSPVRLGDEEWVKELGDCFWYAAGICSVMGYKLDEVIDKPAGVLSSNHTLTSVQHTLLTSAVAVCELSKKFLFYEQVPVPATLRNYLWDYLSCLLFLCRVSGHDPLVVCEKNIKKLEARFGGKFDAYRAINRDLGAESAAVVGVSS